MKARLWQGLGCVVVLGAALWWVRQPDAPVMRPQAAIASAESIAPTPHSEQEAATSVASATSAQTANKTIGAISVKKPVTNIDWERELIASLIVMGDADSLMAAALILHSFDSGDPRDTRAVQRLLKQAQALVPGDRTVASVALRVCRSMRGCNAAHYDQRMRDIDRQNALGPLPEYLKKIESASPGDVAEALGALAQLRLNLYHADLLPRIARVIAAAPTTPRNAPDTVDLFRTQSELTLRVVGAIEVPSYLSLGAACQVNNWRTTLACERIARDLGQAELFELQRLGLGMEENISGTRAKRDSDLEQAESYLNWLGSRMTRRPPPAEQWIPLIAQHRTEMAASIAWLEHSGVAVPSVPRWLGRVR